MTFNRHRQKVNLIGGLLIALENVEEHLSDLAPLLGDEYPAFFSNLKLNLQAALDRVRLWHRLYEKQERIFRRTNSED